MGRERSRRNHDLTVQRIDVALGRGDNFHARNLALEALKVMPASTELQHRVVLAAVRSGAFREAALLLARFSFGPEEKPPKLRDRLRAGLTNPLRRSGRASLSSSNHHDLETDEDEDARVVQARIDRRLPQIYEDVLAFPARCLKDRFWAMPAGPERDSIGADARAAYERAFQAKGGAYSGINAATLARAVGDTIAAERIAKEVLRLVGSSTDYWSCVTRAEAHAVSGHWSEAVVALSDASTAKGANPGSIASTRLQFHRLATLLGPDMSALITKLPQIGVAAFIGHMMSGCANE